MFAGIEGGVDRGLLVASWGVRLSVLIYVVLVGLGLSVHITRSW